jgi:broad specificity phosphatase PhoE
MKKIWLVRHGQSQSQSAEDDDVVDPKLSELGRQQAMRLVKPLQNFELDLILISPLRRAWQTYQLSRIQNRRCEFDSRLIESDWGIAGWYQDILPVKTPDLAAPDRHNAWLEPIEKRTTKLVADLVKRPHNNILLFGHWGIFNHIFAEFAGIDRTKNSVRAPMDNTAISLLELDDDQNHIIRYWNDRAHVADILP